MGKVAPATNNGGYKSQDIPKVIHPNSRKAQQLERELNKEKKKKIKKTMSNKRLNFMGERLAWFRDNMSSHISEYTKQDIYNLIYMYLTRFQVELDQIAIKYSIKGRHRQHASREDSLRNTIERENNEFNTIGIETADFSNKANVEYLKKWAGELKYVPKIKTCRYKRSDFFS